MFYLKVGPPCGPGYHCIYCHNKETAHAIGKHILVKVKIGLSFGLHTYTDTESENLSERIKTEIIFDDIDKVLT